MKTNTIYMENKHLIDDITNCLKTLNPCKVILFGSYANGTPTQDSDIDIAVILDNDKMALSFDERIERQRPVSAAVRDIRRQIAMDIIVYSKAEANYLKMQKDMFFNEIEETGKVLYAR